MIMKASPWPSRSGCSLDRSYIRALSSGFELAIDIATCLLTKLALDVTLGVSNSRDARAKSGDSSLILKSLRKVCTFLYTL